MINDGWERGDLTKAFGRMCGWCDSCILLGSTKYKGEFPILGIKVSELVAEWAKVSVCFPIEFTILILFSSQHSVLYSTIPASTVYS
jgi:hypothetical protein